MPEVLAKINTKESRQKAFETKRKKWLKGGLGFVSKPQQILYDAIKKLYPDTILNDTTILKGFMIDVTIPSLKIAIEYDGWYWHQDKPKDIERAGKLRAKGWKVLNIRAYKDIHDPKEFQRIVKRFIGSNRQHEWVCVGEAKNKKLSKSEQFNIFPDRRL